MTPNENWQIVDLLTGLVEKSLVVFEETADGGGRYRLLETVRQYGRERLLETGEGAAARENHRRFSPNWRRRPNWEARRRPPGWRVWKTNTITCGLHWSGARGPGNI